jgi:hypothetical protein
MSDQTNQPVAGPQSVGRTPADIPPGHPNPASITAERAAAAASRPEYRRGHLTRAGMDTVHARGESVMYQGRVIPPGHPLPDETDLAAGDEVAEQQVRDGIEAQRRALDEQERKLIAASGQRRTAMEEAEKARQQREEVARRQGGADDADETYGDENLTLAQLDGLSDEQILEKPGIGDATLHKIKLARGKRDRAAR